MKELKQIYIDFINYYDPYNQNEAPEESSEMLYNLKEIKKEIEELNEPCNDWSQTLNRLNYAIGQFEKKGVVIS